MIRHFMTVVNDGRAALLDPRECIRIISDMFAAVQRINPIHIARCEYEGKPVSYTHLTLPTNSRV